MASDVKFGNRFGENTVFFQQANGEVSCTICGLTARAMQYFEEQKAALPDAGRATASDRLLMRIGLIRCGEVLNPDGEIIAPEWERVECLGKRIRVLSDESALEFPSALTTGLAQAIWLLSNLTNKETAELIFTGPRASSSEAAPGSLNGVPAGQA